MQLFFKRGSLLSRAGVEFGPLRYFQVLLLALALLTEEYHLLLSHFHFLQLGGEEISGLHSGVKSHSYAELHLRERRSRLHQISIQNQLISRVSVSAEPCHFCRLGFLKAVTQFIFTCIIWTKVFGHLVQHPCRFVGNIVEMCGWVCAVLCMGVQLLCAL